MTSTKKIPEWPTEMVNLGDGKYAYVQSGGGLAVSNAGLVTGTMRNMVIDTLAKANTPDFIKSINEIIQSPINYLVLTHNHPDHFGGSFLFPENTVLVSHSECLQTMQRMYLHSLNRKDIPPPLDNRLALERLPEITFDDSLTVDLGNRKVRFMYFGKAHTTGDIIALLDDDGIVFCGDILFLYSTPHLRGSYIRSWIEALDKLAGLSAARYVPGHGPVCDRKGLLKCKEYLTTVFEEIKKCFDKGMPFREAVRDIKLGEFKQWTHPERILINTYRIYEDLAGNDLTQLEDPTFLLEEMREMAKSGW